MAELILPRPYYQDSAVTIYHADCREILPLLPKVDLVLTDPPYGISHPCNFKSRGRGNLASCSDYPDVYGDNEDFEPSRWTRFPCVLWGANHYASRLPDASGWLVWDKRVQEGKGVNDQSDAEIGWSNFVKGVRVFRHMWNGFWRDSERGESYHPTQKPAALMRWVLTLPWTPEGLLIDPYMGSGPVLVAAKNLGRKAIGIEIEEKYCEIAAKRMAQEVLEFKEQPCQR